FQAAADRMIKANLDVVPWTNGILRSTNFAFGGNWVRDAFSATNIQIFHRDAGRGGLNTVMTYATNNEDTASVHRMLQLAANIHDSMHVQHLQGGTNDYPSVFRPMFVNTATNLSICGYIEENNIGFLNFPTFTVEEAYSRLGYNFAISN